MCKPAKAFGGALGTVFTGGLNKTNLGGGIFKKIGGGVGDVLTLGTGRIPSGSSGGGGGGGGAGGGGFALSPNNPAYTGQPFAQADTDRLAKIFAPVQEAQFQGIESDTGDALKKLRQSQAARGLLRSGISDYPTTELYKGADIAKGNVRSGLANILGTTEAQRSLYGTQADIEKQQATDEFNRNLQLVDLISKANKQSKLSQIFQGVGAFAPIIGSLFGSGGAGTSALAKLFGGSQSALDYGSMPTLSSGAGLEGLF